MPWQNRIVPWHIRLYHDFFRSLSTTPLWFVRRKKNDTIINILCLPLIKILDPPLTVAHPLFSYLPLSEMVTSCPIFLSYKLNLENIILMNYMGWWLCHKCWCCCNLLFHYFVEKIFYLLHNELCINYSKLLWRWKI